MFFLFFVKVFMFAVFTVNLYFCFHPLDKLFKPEYTQLLQWKNIWVGDAHWLCLWVGLPLWNVLLAVKIKHCSFLCVCVLGVGDDVGMLMTQHCYRLTNYLSVVSQRYSCSLQNWIIELDLNYTPTFWASACLHMHTVCTCVCACVQGSRPEQLCLFFFSISDLPVCVLLFPLVKSAQGKVPFIQLTPAASLISAGRYTIAQFL